MSLFLTAREASLLKSLPANSPAAELLAAMETRVCLRASSPEFTDPTATTDWWHYAAEYLTDAALIHAVRPSPKVGSWLRSAVLGVIRRPLADWAGPPFRGFDGKHLVGSLETSHLTWGIAVAVDLASDLFTDTERSEVRDILRTNGLIACRRFLENTNFCHNWNCVLLAGFAVSAAVLGDDDAVAEAVAWFPLAADHFQPDGSYGESLQYANYAAYSIIIAREAILRRSPSTQLTLEPYARMVQWAAQALFYRKPLSGWGEIARARSANFGDSAALFRPSGDLLIHIATHARESMPVEAGLARWLFDALYFPANEPPPHDLASFGFLPGFGFLSVILLADAAAALSPSEAGLAPTAAFSGGDVFARDRWNGLTTLAVRTPSEPRHATAHIHGDINSFILVHRNERLLVDPGHSCYRNLNHDLEAASLTHNTCTFEVGGRVLTQRGGINRPIIRDGGTLRGADPIDLGGRRLLAARVGPVSVIGSDAATLYGEPLRTFTRFWVLCGQHALFIVDRIESEKPVRATWHWLFNNRDNLLDLQFERPDGLLARRGDAGLKLKHFGGGRMSGPVHAYVHDAYHPKPAQRGEGLAGSGEIIRWTESESATCRTVVHALAMDSAAAISGWRAEREGDAYSIANSTCDENWTLLPDADGAALHLKEFSSRRSFLIGRDLAAIWSVAQNPNPYIQ